MTALALLFALIAAGMLGALLWSRRQTIAAQDAKRDAAVQAAFVRAEGEKARGTVEWFNDRSNR